MNSFFPFHPRRMRRGLLAGAVAGLLLGGWALWGAFRASEQLGLARAGVSLGLAFAFLYARHRLRPRAGWGLTLGPESLRLSRPFSNTVLEVPWNEVDSARRIGPRQDAVAILLTGDRGFLFSSRLFASQADFQAAAEALLDLTQSVEKTRRPTGIVQ